MSVMDHFGTWLLAASHHWVWLMSGIGGLLAQMMERSKRAWTKFLHLIRWPIKEQSVPKTPFNNWVVFVFDNVFWIVGVFCILMACFKAWDDQHKIVMEFQESAQLDGEIENYNTGAPTTDFST